MRREKFAFVALLGVLLAWPAMAQTQATQTTDPAPVAASPAPAQAEPAARPKARRVASNKPTITTPVNINTATLHQLGDLPGIGKGRSQKIIASRPYKSIDDLENRRIVPHNIYEKIKDKVKI